LKKELRSIVYLSQVRKWSIYLFQNNAFQYSIFNNLRIEKGEKYNFVVLMKRWADAINYKMDDYPEDDKVRICRNFIHTQFHNTFAFIPQFTGFNNDFWTDCHEIFNDDIIENFYLDSFTVINKMNGREHNHPLRELKDQVDSNADTDTVFKNYAQQMIEIQNLEPELKRDILDFIQNHTWCKDRKIRMFLIQPIFAKNGDVQYVKGQTSVYSALNCAVPHSNRCQTIEFILEKLFPSKVRFEDDHYFFDHVNYYNIADRNIMVENLIQEWNEKGVSLPEPCEMKLCKPLQPKCCDYTFELDSKHCNKKRKL
jgi:hypothetical protein